jgi:hypothetical protein
MNKPGYNVRMYGNVQWNPCIAILNINENLNKIYYHNIENEKKNSVYLAKHISFLTVHLVDKYFIWEICIESWEHSF